MKVIIAGGRKFNNYSLLKIKCNNILQYRGEEKIEIVSGTASGADLLGEKYAREKGFAIKRFPANWTLHKNSAGFIRNKEMAEYADALIAFWDGESKGTSHMINLAGQNNLLIRVIRY